MKKFIALGVALMVLLFGFATNATVAVAENEANICEDIEPQPYPNDKPLSI